MSDRLTPVPPASAIVFLSSLITAPVDVQIAGPLGDFGKTIDGENKIISITGGIGIYEKQNRRLKNTALKERICTKIIITPVSGGRS